MPETANNCAAFHFQIIFNMTRYFCQLAIGLWVYLTHLLKLLAIALIQDISSGLTLGEPRADHLNDPLGEDLLPFLPLPLHCAGFMLLPCPLVSNYC